MDESIYNALSRKEKIPYLAQAIRDMIVRDTGVSPELFEKHIFDVEAGLGIRVWECSGPLSETWGYKNRQVHEKEFLDDLINWRKYFEDRY